jgi:hypothetical protein
VNALDMIREDASEQRGDPTVTVDAKALAKLLALADAAVAETVAWENLCAALDAYEAEEDSSDEIVAARSTIVNVCRDVYREAGAARVAATAALTEPTP